MIEDWRWAHTQFDPLPIDGSDPDRVPMTRLLVEALTAFVTSPGIVSAMTIEADKAIIERGDVACDPRTFDVADHYDAAGRTFRAPEPPGGARCWTGSAAERGVSGAGLVLLDRHRNQAHEVRLRDRQDVLETQRGAGDTDAVGVAREEDRGVSRGVEDLCSRVRGDRVEPGMGLSE